MIDHVLGRPSTTARKYQVILVVLLWTLYLYKGNRNGPRPVRRISKLLSIKLTAWHTVVSTLLAMYLGRNFDAIAGLESPEPLANLYSPTFFRATWVATALDAGYWSAMRIRNRPMREILSFIFSLYYLVAADRADEKVRQIRSALTVEHLRVSWNKGTTGILGTLSDLARPRLTSYPPRALRIPRPKGSRYSTPVKAWLYFDGPLTSLYQQTRIVLDIPGGGFVAMSPRHHEDRLLAWAGRLGIPVLSLDYGKAPEYPYPYALHECFDVYRMIMETRGCCLGLSGQTVPRVILTGDSAGGNLATGTVLLLLQATMDSQSDHENEWMSHPSFPFSSISEIPPELSSIPLPDGVVLTYPTLNMNIANWMSEEQMSLIADRGASKSNKVVLRQKSDDYRRVAVAKSLGAVDPPSDSEIPRPGHAKASVPAEPKAMRLATSSIISYFNDRIITPEMMRAMILLYIGPPHEDRPPPSFRTDFYLSPVLAPDYLLERFPPLRMLTGERDPLVDDTVVFAGRVRAARRARRERGDYEESWRDAAASKGSKREHVQVSLIPALSHGFLNLIPMFPEGWKYIYRCTQWIDDLLLARDWEILSSQPFQQGCEQSPAVLPFQDLVSTPPEISDPEASDSPMRAAPVSGPPPSSKKIRGSFHLPAASDDENGADDEDEEDRPLEMAPAKKSSKPLETRLHIDVGANSHPSARSSKDTIATPASSTIVHRNQDDSPCTSPSEKSAASPQRRDNIDARPNLQYRGRRNTSDVSTTALSRYVARKEVSRSLPAPNVDQPTDSVDTPSSLLSPAERRELRSIDWSVPVPQSNGARPKSHRADDAASLDQRNATAATPPSAAILAQQRALRFPPMARSMSIYSLPSQEDLLQRRMEGLTGALGVGTIHMRNDDNERIWTSRPAHHPLSSSMTNPSVETAAVKPSVSRRGTIGESVAEVAGAAGARLSEVLGAAINGRMNGAKKT